MMAVSMKAKRVSDPLDERVKARLLNTSSGGSGCESGSSRVALSGLVHAFLDLDESATSATTANAEPSCQCRDTGDLSSTHVAETVQNLLRRGSNSHLSSIVSAAVEAAAAECDKQAVMTQLRDEGYDAGICRVKWERSVGLTAGSYTYIDIVARDNERYIVDLEFRAQFEVARATVEYEKVVVALPSVMVGREEEVRRVVRAVAEAANRSLKAKGLSVPPWRKRRYMMNKWFGNYRRTVAALPTGGTTLGTGGRGEVIRCRVVGFGSENLRGVELSECMI